MAAAANQLCAEAFLAGFRPDPDMTVSQWAAERRTVPKPSPEPGPWQNDRVPYGVQIMDDLTPGSNPQIVVLQKAAQGAGTEFGLNAIGCWMDLYPNAMMAVTPTTKTVRRFSRTRIDRLIDACPTLRDKTATPKSRDGSNTIEYKEFGIDYLILTGANSGPDLRSNPLPLQMLDEVDGFPIDVDGEGCPVELTIQRTAAFANRKIFMNSTPTITHFSRINNWYRKGNQCQYFLPCPACGHMQVLLFSDKSQFWTGPKGGPGGLKWPKGSPELVRYECAKCEERFEEYAKIEMFAGGAWRAGVPDRTGGMIHSYHVSALIYPYGWPGNAWHNLAEDWERKHHDPVARKTFINLKLGETYTDPGEAKADVDTLMSRREAFGPEIPERVGCLTFGADVQADRIEVELVGWGPDEESWSLEYKVFPGDTSDRKAGGVWSEFDAWTKSEILHETGIALSIRAGCVDSQYNTETVRKWCFERRIRKIWAIAGKSGQGRPVWPLKLGKQQKGKYPPPYIVGVDSAKESIYNRLKNGTPGPGFPHFPAGRDRYYFEMLTSEVRVPDYTGPIPTFLWRKKQPGARNEALDCRAYAYAALVGLMQSTAFRLNVECDRMKRMAAAPKAEDKPAAPNVFEMPVLQRIEDPYL